jgi:hypothetical protein
MEPDDTIDAIRSQDRWTSADVDRLRDLSGDFPDDPYLWDTLGDVSQMTDSSAVGNGFALNCYLNAVRADPDYGPAHNSLGYWHDIAAEFLLAKHHFERAIELGVGDVARVGLARVLAQMGCSDDASATLDSCDDPAGDSVVELRREIAEGVWVPYPELDDRNLDGG